MQIVKFFGAYFGKPLIPLQHLLKLLNFILIFQISLISHDCGFRGLHFVGVSLINTALQLPLLLFVHEVVPAALLLDEFGAYIPLIPK